MTNESILTKIKALLAKAASTTNEHEAEAFASKAFEMMEKYQIDIDAIKASDDPVGKDSIYSSKADSNWQSTVASATAGYYGCKCVKVPGYKGHTIEMFGRESARITAAAMLPYFIKTINWHAREMAKETGWEPYKCAGQVGKSFAARLWALTRERASEAPATVTARNALIRLDEVQALIDATYGELSKGRKSTFKSSHQARDRAASISLSSQMGRGANAGLLR